MLATIKPQVDGWDGAGGRRAGPGSSSTPVPWSLWSLLLPLHISRGASPLYPVADHLRLRSVSQLRSLSSGRKAELRSQLSSRCYAPLWCYLICPLGWAVICLHPTPFHLYKHRLFCSSTNRTPAASCFLLEQHSMVPNPVKIKWKPRPPILIPPPDIVTMWHIHPVSPRVPRCSIRP